MYKIFIRFLPLITLPLLAMEETIQHKFENESIGETSELASEQANIQKLLKILRIKETPLFYEAIRIVKQFNDQELETLPIENKKKYVINLKQQINKKLFYTIISNDDIEVLLNFGANINAQNGSGSTLLSKASEDGKYKLVKLLLKRGANPNIPNSWGVTPLIKTSIAISSPQTEAKQIKIAQILIENDANVNAVDSNNNTALSFASRAPEYNMMQLLLEHGADPNIQNTTYKATPLMMVSEIKTTDKNKQDQINIVKLLIMHGAKLFNQNYKGKTALDLAQDKGNSEVVNILKEAMSKRGQDIFQQSLYHY